MIWLGSALVLAGILVLLSWQGFQTEKGGGFPRSHLEIARANGTKVGFRVEVATTPEQQHLGLMFREHLDADTGMIFLYPEDQPIGMWMKNTKIPLDMLFVEHTGRIAKIIVNAVPEDLTPLMSDAPERAVIEIGGGEAARQNIRVGDRVVFSGLSDQP